MHINVCVHFFDISRAGISTMNDVLTEVYKFADLKTKLALSETNKYMCAHHESTNTWPVESIKIDIGFRTGSPPPRHVLRRYTFRSPETTLIFYVANGHGPNLMVPELKKHFHFNTYYKWLHGGKYIYDELFSIALKHENIAMADYIYKDGLDPRTDIRLACEYLMMDGRTASVKYLIEAGLVDVNAPNLYHRYEFDYDHFFNKIRCPKLIHYAAHRGNGKMYRMLINHGADIHTNSDDLLYIALDNYKIFDDLYRRGADLRAALANPRYGNKVKNYISKQGKKYRQFIDT